MSILVASHANRCHGNQTARIGGEHYVRQTMTVVGYACTLACAFCWAFATGCGSRTPLFISGDAGGSSASGSGSGSSMGSSGNGSGSGSDSGGSSGSSSSSGGSGSGSGGSSGSNSGGDSGGCGAGDTPCVDLVSLASGVSPGYIAVSPAGVYWNDCSSGVDYDVVMVPLGGGTTSTLATGSYPNFFPLVSSIATGGASVYWTSSNNLMSVPVGGGATDTLASGTGITDIAVDATSAYWLDGIAHAVMKVPLAGGTATTLASQQDFPAGIAVDATSVYWTKGNVCSGNTCNGSVMRVPLGGGTPATLASGLQTPTALAVDGTSAYWSTASSCRMYSMESTCGTVMRVPLGGGTPTTLASEPSVPTSRETALSGSLCTDGRRMVRRKCPSLPRF